jgi:hypothetical protein
MLVSPRHAQDGRLCNGAACNVLIGQDNATLCMVSAGICAASALVPRDGGAEVSAAKQGLRVNVWFGDYIEAAYPFMERDPVCWSITRHSLAHSLTHSLTHSLVPMRWHGRIVRCC